MFTGIIESTGKIEKIEGAAFFISASFVAELTIGQSVAHDGVCLTVTEIFENSYRVDVIPETLKRSNFSKKKVGDIVNLERCMKVDGRFDGHIVQGHCDFVGTLESITQDGISKILHIHIPEIYEKFFVEKGSVTVNGISLTVIQAEKTFLSVGIIPHTFHVTNLHTVHIGDLLNIETDVFAKYFVKHFG